MPPPGPLTSRHDKTIQATDFDALSSKFSAVTKKYLDDEFAPLFVSALKSARVREPFLPKLPLINRGTYVRCKAIDVLIEEFIQKGGQQIISLGAGSDTRAFSLIAKHEHLIYHELDFAVSVERKARVIENSQRLSSILGPLAENGPYHTENYYLHPIDLRTVTATTSLLFGMDATLQTLILSECCLCYLQPEDSSKVLNWLLGQIPSVGLTLYEPIGLNDSFGAVMLENLAQRGISLPTLMKYSTLESQKERLRNHGLNRAFAADFRFIHDNWLTTEDRKRIDSLEFLDEHEELTLLLKHYCIVWGTAESAEWTNAWAQLPHQD